MTEGPDRAGQLTVQLQKDAALVLDAMLARFDAYNSTQPSTMLSIEHPGERVALWLLEAALERVLVEPLQRDYLARVDDARRRLAERAGL
jgi:hypothetical protein